MDYSKLTPKMALDLVFTLDEAVSDKIKENESENYQEWLILGYALAQFKNAYKLGSSYE